MSRLEINVWKTKHNKKETPISEFTDEELQSALYIVHKRQLGNLHRIKIDDALERALEKEAKKRKVTLVSLALADNPVFSERFKKKKPIVETITGSLYRKEKQLQKLRENEE